MDLTAKWIWKKQDDYTVYNQTIVARKSFRVRSVASASVAITADSFYRLYVNGQWVNDGPCRSWPEHYRYDAIDVAAYLIPGDNEIEIVAQYFGVGTFHQVPQQAGLLFQLDLVETNGASRRIVSDGTWDIAEARGWLRNVPKISIQMRPGECFDANKAGAPGFEKAGVLFGAHDGPWKDLQPRDCRLLTKEPIHFHRFVESNVVSRSWTGYTFATARLLHPSLVEANYFTSLAGGIATVVVSDSAQVIGITAHGYRLTVNGEEANDGRFRLRPGENLLLGLSHPYFSHQTKESCIFFETFEGIRLQNPLKASYENPWTIFSSEGGDFVENDIVWIDHADRYAATTARIEEALRRIADHVVDKASFKRILGDTALLVPSSEMLLVDPHRQFVARTVLPGIEARVERPDALIYDTPDTTVVHPSPEGDVELVYDLGQQECGYFTIDLIAQAGAIVDIFGVEYIARSGRVQHTTDNRNGLRYVCKDGLNRFVSLVRRSGRFVYVTLRNLREPVAIRRIDVISSTYPVDPVGSFDCSDPNLARIWDISAHTLKLCMEDTFTDCPLYEQTLWVGDARNEAVFAFTAFGAQDLAKRCIVLAGQSLERYPLVGCQVPSAWECLLPAWSFLWGVSVWDYYFYTGDKAFLRECWGWVKTNLKAAEQHLDECGLFSGPYWNMFDWSGIDDRHCTVLHNSMLLVGAIDAARACGAVLGDSRTAAWLDGFRKNLVASINRLWDNKKGAYPDSIHADGSISSNTSQHTSFLGVLYDVVARRHLKTALENCIAPPKDMVPVGSPFAIMYLYEALEKAGKPDEIVKSVRANYQPMVDDGATTVWESFSTGSLKQGDFPTRSHCHAWSSAPVHFLNRVILGIRQVKPGGEAFVISPRINGLRWARGANATVRGPVSVSWEIVGERLDVTAKAPIGTGLRFVTNDSMKGLKVRFHNASE